MTQKQQGRRSFKPNFEADVLRFYQWGIRTIGQVVRDLGLPGPSVQAWVQ